MTTVVRHGPTRSHRRAEILARPEAAGLVATVVHEATHQMAFNCGLHARLAPVPVWVSEGIATYFETPDLRSRTGWRGIGGVNQSMNNNYQMTQMSMNRFNGYYDANMNRVQITRVQQVNDRAFFQQGNRWVDGSAINGDRVQPDDTVAIGSPEFMQLVDKLVAQNRQGNLAMSGEILLHVDGKNVLVIPGRP